MSTRANIILKDGDSRLFFYRHSDGYPEGTKPTLDIFCNLIKTGKIRNNLSQCAGWLILLGAVEYQSLPADLFSGDTGMSKYDKADEALAKFVPLDWKVGAYEPTDGIHGDIEYLYIVDVTNGTYEIATKNFQEYAK
jgi:hypothetical protein